MIWIAAGVEYASGVGAAMLMIWFLVYGSTIGPTPYAIASEVGATELRSKTIVLSRSVWYILSLTDSGISPYMLNPSRWDLKGKAAFPRADFTVCLVMWTYFRLPETKSLMPATPDHLFHEKVTARRFGEEAKRFQ